MLLLPIINGIILPIFIMMAIGFLGDRLLKFDLRTLTRTVFYIMSPATLFLKIAESQLQAVDMLYIAALTILHLVIMFGLGLVLFGGKRFAGNQRLLAFGTAMYNAGNYGLPLMLLAFGDEGLSVMAIVFITNAITLHVGGVLLFITDKASVGDALRRLLTIPVIYALPLALIVRGLGIVLPPAFAVPIARLDNAYVAISLLTLGAQLSRSASDVDDQALLFVPFERECHGAVARVLHALAVEPLDLHHHALKAVDVSRDRLPVRRREVRHADHGRLDLRGGQRHQDKHRDSLVHFSSPAFTGDSTAMGLCPDHFRLPARLHAAIRT